MSVAISGKNAVVRVPIDCSDGISKCTGIVYIYERKEDSDRERKLDCTGDIHIHLYISAKANNVVFCIL
jgi:hypothetical protein